MIARILCWLIWVAVVVATLHRGRDTWRDAQVILRRAVFDPWVVAFELTLWATINVGTLAFVLRGHP